MTSLAEGLSSEQLAREVALDLPNDSYVNLGIGIPQKVSRFIIDGRGIFLHCENGILGLGPPANPGEEDPDLIDAGKVPVTLAVGGSYISHADSFAIIRGGHLDACVLGGYQVSRHGDLSNWNDGEDIPAVGGAMDLALGARTRIVMMKHNDKRGRAKLVAECSLPLTARECVDRVYTELGIFEPFEGRFRVLGIAQGVSAQEIQDRTDVEIVVDADPRELPRRDVDTLAYGVSSRVGR